MAAGTRVARQSRDTVYYRMMQRGIPEFFAAAELAGRDVPKFIADELNGFLDCGDLARGFAKVDCHDCGHHFVVGFSCKGRGACLKRRSAVCLSYDAPIIEKITWLISKDRPGTCQPRFVFEGAVWPDDVDSSCQIGSSFSRSGFEVYWRIKRQLVIRPRGAL